MSEANTLNMWLVWTAAALLASLTHVLIDFHIGLYGETSPQMTPLQAANLFLTSLVYGWWMYTVAVARSGDRSALLSALAVTVLFHTVALMRAEPLYARVGPFVRAPEHDFRLGEDVTLEAYLLRFGNS